MFLAGFVLLIATSVVFTGGFTLLKPEKPFERYTQGQALLVLLGFGLVSVWQLYVNQAVVLSALATLAPLSNLAVTFAIDNGIAEEVLLGAFAIFIYVSIRYFGFGKLEAATTATVAAAAFFTWLHTYPNVYGNIPQALIFVFGARLILAGVMFGTLRFSRFKEHPSASLAAPPIIHIAWNVVTLIGASH